VKRVKRMNRFEGLERDVTYLSYCKLKDKIIDIVKNDDSELDVDYIKVLLYLLKNDRLTLDAIKKEKENGREDKDDHTKT
jgi:hypothetical protein